MVYSANLCVNLRDRLCDVARHVSAQSLDFLDLDEISSFLNWKHQLCPSSEKRGHGWTLIRIAGLTGNRLTMTFLSVMDL